jgi:positive regulator of sigma E activity
LLFFDIIYANGEPLLHLIWLIVAVDLLSVYTGTYREFWFIVVLLTIRFLSFLCIAAYSTAVSTNNQLAPFKLLIVTCSGADPSNNYHESPELSVAQ